MLAVAALLVPTLASAAGDAGGRPLGRLVQRLRRGPPRGLRRQHALLSSGPVQAALAVPTLHPTPAGVSLGPCAPCRPGFWPWAAWARRWPPIGSSGALQEATKSLGKSEVFTGLVVVAIASNAVEHAVGIRFALKAKPEVRHKHHR